MPKKIAQDVFGELLETGKQTVKGMKQVVTGTKTKNTNSKTTKGFFKQSSSGKSGDQDKGKSIQELLKQRKMAENQAVSEKQNEKKRQTDQLEKMKKFDADRSQKRYKEIQVEIRKLQKLKESKPRKYITGEQDFDKEQIDDPESYMEKMEKKKKEFKKDQLSRSVKQRMGTGELARGASG